MTELYWGIYKLVTYRQYRAQRLLVFQCQIRQIQQTLAADKNLSYRRMTLPKYKRCLARQLRNIWQKVGVPLHEISERSDLSRNISHSCYNGHIHDTVCTHKGSSYPTHRDVQPQRSPRVNLSPILTRHHRHFACVLTYRILSRLVAVS